MRNSSLFKHTTYTFLISFAAICLYALPSIGQTPVFSNYTVEDGLPSSESYFSLQDSKGYIWVSTDRGVARYDGYEFELFTTDNGLTDNVVFKMYEDNMGRVWFAPFSLKLSYYQNGEIHIYPYNDIIAEKLGEAVVHNFIVDSLGTIHIGSFEKGYLRIDKNGKTNKQKKYNRESFKVEIREIQGQLFGATIEPPKNRSKRSWNNSREKKLFIFEKGEEATVLDIPFYNNEYAPGSNFSEHLDPVTKDTYLGIAGILYKYLPNENKLKKLWHAKTSIYWIHSNERWLILGTNKNGLYVFDKNNSSKEPTYHFLDGTSVSALMEDKEGGYWVTTLENGLYHTSSIENLAYTEEDGLSENYVSALGGNKQGDLLIGHRNSKLDLIKDGKYYKSFELAENNKMTEITVIRYDSLNEHNIITGPGLFSYQNNQISTIHESINPIDFEYLGNEKWLMCRMNLFMLDHDSLIYLTGKSNQPNSRCLHSLNKDSILLGGLNGLYLYNNEDYSFLGDKSPLLSYRVTDIKAVKGYNFALATRGAGVVLVGNKDTINITEEHGLAGNQLNRLFVDKDKNIWAISNKGVSMLSANDPYVIHTLNTQQGLLSNEVTSVYVDNEYAWIGTKKGMNRIPKKQILEMAKPLHVMIKSILVNSKEISIQDNNPIEMSYDRSFLQLELATLDYRSAGNPTYRYRFKELGNEWIEILSNAIQIPSIPSGEHTLELMAKNEDGIWSTIPTQLFFNVSYPFWMAWWFYLSSLVLVGGLISGYNYIQLQRANERTRLKEEIRNYQQQAFTAQMNPHFIFNSLNSIQNFIVQNDSKQSNRYLAKFAKLMRMVLANSQTPKVSIEDEMTTLSFYLELEALRFNQSLSYEIEIDKSIDKEKALIPTLLIQPFVENAIWHGIMHKEEGGELKIKLYLIEDQLKCSIEDNGIGRKAAEMLHTKKTHKSFSSSATQKRLALLTEEYKMDYEFSIEDLQDKQGKGTGTVVSFQLPYELHEN